MDILIVELTQGDFDSSKAFVRIGKLAMAISKAKNPDITNANDLQDIERKLFAGINAAVQLGNLKPLHPQTLKELSKCDYGLGIVPFAELVEWGKATKLFDFRISKFENNDNKFSESLSNTPHSLSDFPGVSYPAPDASALYGGARNLPDWNFWKHIPEVDVWQACALAFNIDPDSMRRSRNQWMAPLGSEVFLQESFPNEKTAKQFDMLMRIVKARLIKPHLKTRLPEFSAWCAPILLELSGCDIPPELAAMAKSVSQAPPLSRAERGSWDNDDMEFSANGRYQLGLAAMIIANRASAGLDSMMHKLFEAAGAGELIVYERGKDEVYRFNPNWKLNIPLKDNEAFLEAKWHDLNAWLKIKEPGIFETYKFPEPDAPTAKVEAKPVTTPSSDDWKEKARAIADRLAVEKYQRGEREITARNICEAVAIELAKDNATHGNRGERSADGIRNEALKGWKFIPPTGTNGISGTK